MTTSLLNALGHQADIPEFEKLPDGGVRIINARPYVVQWDEREREQMLVNKSFDVMDRSFTIRLIKRLAAERHAHLPQYEGHWEDPKWRLVRFTATINTKGGVRFDVGDITIGHFNGRAFGGGFTAYSLRGEINCSVDYGFELID